jgi:hypothetical protein
MPSSGSNFLSDLSALSPSNLSGAVGIAQGGTNNTTYTSGSLTYFDGTKIAQDNSYLFYDSTNKRLGLGNTAPARTIEITGQSTTSLDGINIKNYSTAGVPTMIIAKARGTQAAPTAVQSGDTLFTIGGNGYNGSAFQTSAIIKIFGSATENYTTTNGGSSLNFMTTPNGSVTAKSRLGIGQDGVLNIYGNTSGIVGLYAAATTTSYNLTLPSAQASGTQYLQNNGIGALS